MDLKNRPDAYDNQAFKNKGKSIVNKNEDHNMLTLLIKIKTVMDKSKYVRCTENQIIKMDTPPLVILSYPVLVASANDSQHASNSGKDTLFRMLDIQDSLSVNCLCIDDVSGSLLE